MMRKHEKLVTIADFKHGSDAELAKLILSESEIESIVMGENAACSWFHVFDNYIKLQVFEKDRKRAKELLAEKMEQRGV